MTDSADLRSRLLDEAHAAPNLDALEALRVRALGKQGEVTALLKTLGQASPEERQRLGPVYNALREELTGAISARRTVLEDAALDARLAAERIDLSLPAARPPQGRIHPISQVMDELAEIFADLGFTVGTGPEIEDEWHNFTALNIPEHHPARAMHDTFYFPEAQSGERGRMLLRTHTSPVQIRSMMTHEAPLRVIAPGRVYRSDSDATHTPMFHQVEALVIDRDITLGHLKWTVEAFTKAFFEVDDVALRFRPSYFPFTEPSMEVDVACSIENGVLDLTKRGRWLEIMGSGMVHPRVLSACGLDPDEWQGFAFGMGIDRIAMLKYGMTDLRAFFDGDGRWIAHYGFDPLRAPSISGGAGA
jgi:phenylalanyl-tRNA synthetase alpha chain